MTVNNIARQYYSYKIKKYLKNVIKPENMKLISELIWMIIE